MTTKKQSHLHKIRLDSESELQVEKSQTVHCINRGIILDSQNMYKYITTAHAQCTKHKLKL